MLRNVEVSHGLDLVPGKRIQIETVRNRKVATSVIYGPRLARPATTPAAPTGVEGAVVISTQGAGVSLIWDSRNETVKQYEITMTDLLTGKSQDYVTRESQLNAVIGSPAPQAVDIKAILFDGTESATTRIVIDAD